MWKQLLDIDFNVENVSDDELYKLLNSIRQKKKYYRLKNGEFLDLEMDQIDKWSQMLEHLEINRDDITKKSAHVPIFRALYMDELAKDEEIGSYIAGTKSFVEMIDNIKNYDQAIDVRITEKILRLIKSPGFKRMKQMTDCGLGVILADDRNLGTCKY